MIIHFSEYIQSIKAYMAKKLKKPNKTNIGGQAVIEGVMMRGNSSMAISVRDEDGVIRVETERLKPVKEKPFIFRTPFIRGILSFVDSLFSGTKILMRSAEVYGEGEPSKFEKFLSEKLKIDIYSVVMFVGVLLGLVLAVGLFMFLPNLATNGIADLTGLEKKSFWFNLIEGGLKMLIFVLYILLTSLMRDVRRTYMYHGAEHKTISCFERGLPLTVENVKSCSRVHDRCGTTFTFLVLFISILVFSLANTFLQATAVWQRVLIKIALLPAVAGISYEILKLLAKTENPIFFIFKAPGLALQMLTTKEPDEDMIEVAIKSFNTVLEMDADPTIEPKKFITAEKCSAALERVKKTLKEGGVEEEAEAEWIISIICGVKRGELAERAEERITPANVEKINAAVKERLTGRPLWYVLGTCDFYGYEFNVDERALIPRPETEELCYNALKEIKAENKVLDLCTGSGAIAITIKLKSGASVTASDISKEALSLAHENAQKLGADISFVESDMFENIEGKFDFILSNPPYIKKEDIKGLQKEIAFEPVSALDGGEDGLDFYRVIAAKAKEHLTENGKLFLEIGYDQKEALIDLFKDFSHIEVLKDASQNDRILVASL